MRTIQRQISLEPMTSRLPSIWPSYHNGEIYFFDEVSLSGREWTYTCNYGLIPLNIVLTPHPTTGTSADGYNITSGCHCHSASTQGHPSYDELCNFVLSFESLSKWYYFFVRYYALLKQCGHCNRVYTSAEDYYNYESATKYASQMLYGSDIETYIGLDNEFVKKGGKVEVLVYNKVENTYSAVTPQQAHDEFSGDNTAIIDVYDIGFFKWICEYVVPSFTIPFKYRNYWKRDVLYYPDVIKWMAWLKPRVDIYGDDSDDEEKNIANFRQEENFTELWDCKSSKVTGCCECEEYFKRGGYRIYSAMREWYDHIQGNLGKIKEGIKGKENCFMPTVIIPTSVNVSIDNLGEMSIFSDEYELGVDYRGVSEYTESANTTSGTVSTIDGNSVILSGGSGCRFSETYMEKYVSSCSTCGYMGVFVDKCPKCGSENGVTLYDWADYSDMYINSHKYEFSNNVTLYTFDENNVKYVASGSVDEAKASLMGQLAKRYGLISDGFGWLYLNSQLYEISMVEYGIYDDSNKYLSGKTFIVEREEFTNTPYTYVNGKKVYSEFDFNIGKFYFPFFSDDTKYFDRYPISDTEGRIYTITYNGSLYNLGDTLISGYTIDSFSSRTIVKYAVDDNGLLLFQLLDEEGDEDDKVYYYDDMLNDFTEYIIDGFDVTIETVDDKHRVVITPIDIDSLYYIYNGNEITGLTVSKIGDLRLFNVLCDDIGNTIDGIYKIDGSFKNHQPLEGCELDLIYEVGNTANISRFSRTSDTSVSGTNYFIGDIIYKMEFYYKDYDDNIVDDTIVTVKLDSGYTKTISVEGIPSDVRLLSLSAIKKSTEKKNQLQDAKTTYMQDDIYCDITYYIGATLSRMSGKTSYSLASIESGSDCKNDGVEYKETVRFVKTKVEYYLKTSSKEEFIVPRSRNNPCHHSLSYPIYIYVLTQDMTRVENSQYDSEYSVPMAEFKVNICTLSGDSMTYDSKYPNEMEKRNGLQVYPTFREEYRLGTSSMENVDSDIYIDRGINSAFEKHLKLGEVSTLEALEKYGLSYFKLMEN